MAEFRDLPKQANLRLPSSNGTTKTDNVRLEVLLHGSFFLAGWTIKVSI
jgi:hypothetical protein